MTLSLFGMDDPWNRLLDDQPIVSGRHPLHLYHGYLGARSLAGRGTSCCFDPSFQAGYPKTPVFDDGSRPAELFLFVAGAAYRPAAYKVGLALCCIAVPFVFYVASRCVGLRQVAACLATTLGLLVWWSTPCATALGAGDLDLLLASLAALAHVSLLLRFHDMPGAGSWLGILVSGCVGWFAHPLFFALFIPLLLVYYLSVGARHQLVWHMAMLGAVAGGVVANLFWLTDWVAYWWIRAPVITGAPDFTSITLNTIWNAPFWGSAMERTLALFVLGAGLVGAFFFNQAGKRVVARLLGLGAAGYLTLAIVDLSWQSLPKLGLAHLIVPSVLFAVQLAVHGVAECVRFLGVLVGSPRLGMALAAGVFIAIGVIVRPQLGDVADRYTRAAPLALGFGPDRQALLTTIRDQTNSAARILWEDRPGGSDGPHWCALLPLLTERAYLGGLDPSGSIEHDFASFRDQTLAGRPLAEWSDEELTEFCRRYNVGWVVCWSPAALARFHSWKDAEAGATLSDQGTGCLFRMRRRPSFVLKGQARWIDADCRHINLADVVPDDGEVILSLHYQSGMQASPGRVQIERERDPVDPIPFVRLRMPGPAARVTISWEGR